jgi:chromosome partitioning protein
MIYTVGGIKGGSGKTTIATNLAIVFNKSGKDVLLIDADDQETASDFTLFRNQTLSNESGYTAIKLSNKAVYDQAIKLKNKYDVIVIDTGGRDTVSQRAAISVSDIFLIPFFPRSFDLWTLQKISDLVQEMQTVNPSLKAFSFLNRADYRGNDNNEVKNFLSENNIIKFIDTPIVNRKVFSNASAQGLGIMEIKPTDKRAIEEFMNLFNVISNDV